MTRSHCAECGYEGPKEGPLPQRGSDVIPIYECPECGDVAAIGCSCDDPDSHEPSSSA
ncbi:hypothetical protein [Saliphagus infecundisoli]|uniref:Small CPxCG-related zinc finger protein n=1 Tax=Saliphagus infecundisoli TaxID=1849069 RepID=A0ABD5QNF2_9EURY|nr:hypothetical protein [Saliphagus infecundisoli]